MTASPLRHLHLLVLSLLCAALASCGGGGGGDDGGASPAGTTLTTSVSSLSFAANRQGVLPDTQSFTVRWTGASVAGIAIGVPPGQTVPPWLTLSTQGSASPVTAIVGVNTTDLAAGDYRVTLRVVSGDINANPIDIADVEVTYTVTDAFAVSETAMTYDAVIDGPAPAPQSFTVTGAGVSWSAVTDRPWVSLSAASGATPATVNVTVDPAGFDIGQQTATITVTNDNNPAETADIAVTMGVRQPAILLSRSIVSFSGTNGRTLSQQAVTFSLENGQVTPWAITPGEPWIVVDNANPTGPGAVQVRADASIQPLASGSYSGELLFTTSYRGTPISLLLPVDLLLTTPTLTVSPQSLRFQGGPASDFRPQNLNLRLGPQAGFEPQSWQVDAIMDNSSGWLSAPATGTISAAVDVPITVDAANQPENRYTGSLDVSVTVNGDVLTESVPVELVLEPHRLFVADNGVALFSSPGLQKLGETVTVSDNRRIDTPWTANSDQAWLSATASGTTDSDLVLAADPTGLATDTIHYASVAISSPATTVTNSGEEIIKVGFYVASATPPDSVGVTLPRLVGAAPGLVADPIRPYVYVTNETADIDVYNVFSGAAVDTISTAGSDLRTLTIASDGDTLYALDFAAGSIVSVDLTAASPAANAPWAIPGSACPCSGGLRPIFEYARINGREVIVGGQSDIIDAVTGDRLLGLQGVSFIVNQLAGAIDASGSILYTANRNSSGHEVSRYLLRYSELDDEFAIDFILRSNYSNFNRGLSTDPAGDRVFRACWYPTAEVEIYNGEDLSSLSLVTSGQNGSALYGPDDLVYCARYYSDFAAPGSGDVWSIDPATRTIVQEFQVPGNVSQEQYAISGGGLRLIVRSNDNEDLTLVSIP